MKYSEEQYEKLLTKEGIIPITVVMRHNNLPVQSWENTGLGTNFNKYWCYVCLASYFNVEVRDYCRRTHTDEENLHPKQMETI